MNVVALELRLVDNRSAVAAPLRRGVLEYAATQRRGYSAGLFCQGPNL